MSNTITTEELDSIARLGLDDLRGCFSGSTTQGMLERADLTVKLIRQATSRYSAENNRVAIGLKVAKAAGLGPEEQKPLWRQIMGGGHFLPASQIEPDPKQKTNRRK